MTSEEARNELEIIALKLRQIDRASDIRVDSPADLEKAIELIENLYVYSNNY